MTLGSLFDGIAGFPYAAAINGITPLWASEIETAPISISKRHFPDMKHLGDIKNINGAEIDPVDVITFGSPCQDLSVAGKRAGLEGKRSGLFMEAMRIIKEMRGKTNGKHPSRIIWENVDGVFSSNRGEDFRIVLEEIANIAGGGAISIPRPPSKDGNAVWESSGAVVGDGWSLAWRILDAQYWGVPQRRKRIFLVGDFRGECAGEILFKPEGLPRNPAESEKQGEGIAGSAKDGVKAAGFNGWRSITGNIEYEEDRAPCLQTKMPPDVVVGVDGYNQNLTGKKANTLRGGRVDKDNIPLVIEDGTVQTLSSRMGTGGGNVPLLMTENKEPTIALDCRNFIANEDVSAPLQAKPNGGQSLNFINPIYCMAARQQAQSVIEDKSPPILGTDYKEPNCVFCNKDTNKTEEVNSRNYSVRRLTPLECERLQGLPDGWTEYGIMPEKYRASLERGKKRTGLPESVLLQKISDSKRYKALGNGMAHPCVDFVVRRVKETA